MGFLQRVMAVQRRSTADGTPLWMGLWGRTYLSDTAAGITVTPEKSLSYTAVLAATRVLAESLAGLPCILYRRLERGKERAVDHYLYPLLHNSPNPRMTAFEFFEIGMVHLALWGNFFAQLVRDGAGRVKEMWPLRPDRVQIYQGESGELWYEYSPAVGEKVMLPAEMVLHVRGMGSDGVRGYSLITLARQAIGLGLAAEEYGARFFSNDARPSVVLVHPGRISEEASKRIRESWRGEYAGVEKSHGVAVLEEGMSINTVGIPPEDAQFLETRKFQVNEIARIFRIPPHMLGDLERATFSNVEQQAIDFVVHTVRPWCRRWEQALELQLLRPGERSKYLVEFLMDGLLRGDTESRYRAYATARQWGWMSINDIRERENMNPVPGGDDLLQPLNMVSVGSEAQGAERSAPAERRSAREVDTAEERRRIMADFEPLLEDVFQRIINREVNDVRNAARRIFGKRDRQEWEAWLEQFYREHEEFVRRYLSPAFITYSNMIINAALKEIGSSPNDVPRAKVERFVLDYIAHAARRHVGFSRSELAKLSEDELDAVLEEWVNHRPGQAAEEEVHRGGNAFAKAAWLAAGVRMLVWRTTSAQPCEFCRRMDGRVVAIEGNFLTSGGELMNEAGEVLRVGHDVGHPPLHRGCKCIVMTA